MAGLADDLWPVQLDIIGPADPIPERTVFQFTATVLMDDNSKQNVQAEWRLTSEEFGTITPTGRFTAGSVSAGTRPFEVHAAYYVEAGEYWLTQTGIFHVKDTDVLPSIVELVIEGPTEVEKSSEADYVVKARYSNGAVEQVVPTTLVSSRPLVAEIDINGHATFKQIRGSASVSFTATYDHMGAQHTRTLSVLVVDSSIYPVRGNVIGPTIITENGSAQFGLDILFENGRNQQVVANWFSTNPKAGTLDCNGRFCAVSVEGVETTTIVASYEFDGTTTSASLELSVLDIMVYPEKLTIDGPQKVREGLVVQYYTTVHFTNGTRKAVQVPVIAKSNVASVDAGNQLHAVSQVAADTEVALFAAYGNLQTQRFVEVVPSPVKPDHAYIELRSPMYVGEYQALKFHVVYEDGTDIVLPTQWSVSNQHIAEISEHGVLHAVQVAETAELFVRAQTFISGVELKAELGVTLIDNKTYPLSVSIDGPDNMRVGIATSYSAVARFSDGSERPVSPLWSCADERVDIQLGRVKSSVPGTYHISVTYSLQHETVTAIKEITIS